MIFSIAMGAEYLFYMKSIETHARAFLALIILGIGTVLGVIHVIARILCKRLFIIAKI